jgi:VirK protein
MSCRDKIRIFATRVVLAGVIWQVATITAIAQYVNPAFASFEKAVLDGRDVRLTLDLSRCTGHGGEARGPQVRGSIRFDAYMIRGDQTIAFATTHFTLTTDDAAVDEFLSFRAHPNGRVDVRTAFLNPVTFSVTRESQFDCDIGQGAIFHWEKG